MSFLEKLNAIAIKIEQQSGSILTEEATKTALVMPFIHTVLGYDIFNPTEVIPEYTCDIGTKKGEKIDYAIVKDCHVQILVECKKVNEPLNINHAGQLFRYFHVTSARIAVLTNGVVYKFFTDLDCPNKMDEKPFLEIDISNLDDHAVPELFKLTRSAFDVESIINAAGEMKYINQIRKLIDSELNNPSDDFVKFIATRVYDGIITQKVRESFASLTLKASKQLINARVNDRLKLAIEGRSQSAINVDQRPKDEVISEESNLKVETTEEELDGYLAVKSIVRSVIDVKRVVMRDTQSYCGILIDDNNRKPVCRLHFNRDNKYLGIIDENKKENRIPIETIDDIYSYADELIDSAKRYL